MHCRRPAGPGLGVQLPRERVCLLEAAQPLLHSAIVAQHLGLDVSAQRWPAVRREGGRHPSCECSRRRLSMHWVASWLLHILTA
eukprot:6597690-Prymnesium_polylepis.2